ncbi:MAG: hypothetical protein Q9174_006109, partial [Haloplaca sp. 1 TL-2023]
AEGRSEGGRWVDKFTGGISLEKEARERQERERAREEREENECKGAEGGEREERKREKGESGREQRGKREKREEKRERRERERVTVRTLEDYTIDPLLPCTANDRFDPQITTGKVVYKTQDQATSGSSRKKV